MILIYKNAHFKEIEVGIKQLIAQNVKKSQDSYGTLQAPGVILVSRGSKINSGHIFIFYSVLRSFSVVIYVM